MPSAADFRRFVWEYFDILSLEARAEAFRFTNAEWSAHVRQMYARQQSEGPGLFCEVDSDSARLPRAGRRTRSAALLQGTSSGGKYVATW